MPPNDSWIDLTWDDDDEDPKDVHDLQDACLFLIECSETMLATPTPEAYPDSARDEFATPSTQVSKTPECSLAQGVRAAYNLMRKKVIASPKDLIGIIVYNTANTEDPNDSQQNNCTVLQDLAPIDAKSIQSLRTLLERCLDPKELLRTFRPQTSQPNALVEGLSAATARFRTKSLQKASKRVLLLTDNIDPFRNGSFGDSILTRYRQTSLTYAKDMKEMNISVEPFFIQPSSSNRFDRRLFWNSFLDALDTNQPEDVEESASMMTSVNSMFLPLLEAASMRENAKRSLWTLPFTIADGLVIGVKGYGMVIEEKKKGYTLFDPHTQQGEEVKVVTEMQDFTSTDKVAASDTLKYCSIGDKDSPANSQRVVLNKDEHHQARTLGLQPSLVLLGFMARSKLPWHLQLKHSYFVFPDDEMYVGSSRAFTALLQSMSRGGSEKIAIAVIMPRKGSTPSLVALLPQREIYENGQQMQPSGLHVCNIPWADEVREPGIASTVGIIDDAEENDAINTAKALIRKLKLRYTPGNFPNPALNFHYSCLAACALREQLPDLDDKTVPRYASLNKGRGEATKAFKEAIGRHPRAQERLGDPIRTTTTKKRPQTQPDTNVEEVVEEVEERFRAGHGKKVVVAKLKAYAGAKQLLEAGAKAPLKAELVLLIANHLGFQTE